MARLLCTFPLQNSVSSIRNIKEAVKIIINPLSRLKKEFSLINLGRIQNLIDAGRLDPAKPITLKSLFDAGIENLQDGVKILASVSSKHKI